MIRAIYSDGMKSHRHSRRASIIVGAFAVLGALVTTGAMGSVSAAASPSTASGWVRDTTTILDVFAPDEATDYYFDAFGTANGARTVISGQVPHARYWSFTVYPGQVHAYDAKIAHKAGHYRLTIASSCNGISGTCLSAQSSGTSGVVLMRLYVPVDLAGAGTGAVPLPAITYENAKGVPITQQQATGSGSMEALLALSRAKHGALPSSLTLPYPAAAPVPVPVNAPPVPVVVDGTGPYANPDNDYLKLPLDTMRGNLVISGEAPTYLTDSFVHANHLNRSSSPQTRYWSLCVEYQGDYTGACVRDEEIHLSAGSRKFVVVVAPSCPVAGYRNCLLSGPSQLQRAVLYRNLLPSSAFAQQALRGPYKLTARYVARPS
jgi:hypothetical protein